MQFVVDCVKSHHCVILEGLTKNIYDKCELPHSLLDFILSILFNRQFTIFIIQTWITSQITIIIILFAPLGMKMKLFYSQLYLSANNLCTMHCFVSSLFLFMIFVQPIEISIFLNSQWKCYSEATHDSIM